ncbi:MAG: transcription-repair coupling factor, partial [Anaerolineales bacterium]
QDEQTKEIQFYDDSLSEGFIFEPDSKKNIHVITDSEIFGWEKPNSRRQVSGIFEPPESKYSDLVPGELVVHVDYGIGLFEGLVDRELDGISKEFLCVRYKDGDQVFVPIHQADRITPYIGATGKTPALGNLGTQEWVETKKRVNGSVQEIAEELLDLYARRQAAKGFAFQKDTLWQKELESSFPYIETDDQLKVLQEVKQDMEMDRPMDRLLCGDVGYGKTEIALRAAFKAVMDGKQVAVLVPTTVLAQQHFDTFAQRLSPFPVTVDMLSRFRTQKEQEEILNNLCQGKVDIIVGTHRLVQKDVIFKDLGLLIIDEEQRFGVTQKEYIKKLRSEIDVLTLTATPIPRTLYMALTGIRDISQINTPPEDRMPIVTHIGPYSQRIVRQAICRELERGGQIFFVHNRVQTIHAMKSHINNLVPEARVGIGHGQMPEQQLSQVMRDFTSGNIDILLCTSIIESGLDIPNANTLIVDRGDTFGLAQLYQLRGRVGRGTKRAYAYFFRHRKKLPTIDGQERLEIIAENTQLGSGYSIAMRDLEMRGAGELLGRRQHGYIAAIGFHLYTRLLASAVKRTRKSIGMTLSIDEDTLFRELSLPVNVELPLDTSIPPSYIEDKNLRLKLYRRISTINNAVELENLKEEFEDRFGPIPQPVDNLFFMIKLKLFSRKAGVTAISFDNRQLIVRFPEQDKNLNGNQSINKSRSGFPEIKEEGI